MSDATQNTSVPSPKSRATLYIVGTAVILLAAGVGYQIWQAGAVAAITDAGPDGQAGTARVAQQHIARVNDYPIPYDIVAQECVNRVGPEVLDNIINRTLIQQECQKQGISVSEAEVNAEVNRIAQRFQIPTETWYQMLEAERGLSEAQYRADVIWPMLALKKLAGGDIRVTQDDMLKAFERDYGQMVKARMVMVNNIRHAQEVHEKARRDPASFDKLAEQYSIEPNSRSLGGVIPHIRRHSGNPVLEAAAFKLQEGQISGIIEVDTGHFVILKCEGFTTPVVKDINAIKDDLYKQVQEEKSQEAVARVFEKIRKEARIDNYLTKRSTGARVQQTSGLQNPADVRPASAVAPNTP